jgi:hypothetical protein
MKERKKKDGKTTGDGTIPMASITREKDGRKITHKGSRPSIDPAKRQCKTCNLRWKTKLQTTSAIAAVKTH